MSLTPQKRKKMEELVASTMTALDPTGENTMKYKEKFKAMTNNQFETYFKKLFSNESDFLTLDVVDYERDLSIQHVENAAKVLNVPLYEKIAMPMVNGSKDSPTLSKEKVPVGYIHTKRLQQIVSKKNTTSTDIGQRSAITGQVTRDDKNSRSSDAENFALVTLDADKTLEEFVSVRTDDMVKKSEMYSDIARKGYANLEGLTNDPGNKTTLNTVDTFLIGMGIKSDLVTDGLLLKGTLDKRDL